MDFKNVPKSYRLIPFWSWNEKLDVEETKDQIHKMDQVGIGGFFMHARGGLQTLCSPSKNGHKKASKNEMNRSISLIY